MQCRHDSSAARLRRVGVAEPLCLECLFEDLASQAAPEGAQVQSVKELAAAVFNVEAKQQRIPGQLLWRTPFLHRACELLATNLSSAALPMLADVVAKCFTEELTDGASSRAAGLGCATQEQLIEALVTCIAQRCVQQPPLLLLQLLAQVLESLPRDSAAANGLERRIVKAVPILQMLVAVAAGDPATPEAEAFEEAPFSLLHRLLEAGCEGLAPAFAESGCAIGKRLATTQPGSSVAAALLALYSLAALHPFLLQSLLERDPVPHAAYLAEGLSHHLASPVAAIRTAAAGLADHLADALPAQVGSTWYRTRFLAEWLVDACRTSVELSARAAAARALRHVVKDDELMQRLQGTMVDALLAACGEAVAAAGGSWDSRQDLLAAAAGTMRTLLGGGCPVPLEPRGLLPLLRAAVDAEADGGVEAMETGEGSRQLILLGDCLLPIQLVLAGRPLSPASAADAAALLEQVTALAGRRDSFGLCSGALWELFLHLLQALRPSLSLGLLGLVPSCDDIQVEEEEEGRSSAVADAQLLQDRLLGCARVLAAAPLPLQLQGPLLGILLWPQLEVAEKLQQAGLIGPGWWAMVDQLGSTASALLESTWCIDGSRASAPPCLEEVSCLLGLLISPLLRRLPDSNGPPLVLPVRDLLPSTRGLLGPPLPPMSGTSWLVLFAALQVSATSSLERAVLTQLAEQNSSSPGFGNTELIALRGLFFLAAACARSAQAAAAESPEAAMQAMPVLEAATSALRGAALQSMASSEALSEWTWLRSGPFADAECCFSLGLSWLLADDDEGQQTSRELGGLLCAVAKLEAAYGSMTPRSEPKWSLLAQLIPSAAWLSEHAAPLVAQVVEEDIASLVSLYSAVAVAAADHSAVFAGRGAVAAAVRRWRRSTAENTETACSQFAIKVLLTAPAVAVEVASAEVLSFLNEAQSGIPTSSLLDLASVSFWRRHEVRGLIAVEGASDLLKKLKRGLAVGGAVGQAAWTALAFSILSNRESVGDQGHLKQGLWKACWPKKEQLLGILNRGPLPNRASALLALSVLLCGHSATVREVLFKEDGSFQALVAAAVSGMGAADGALDAKWGQALRDTSCLALTLLFTTSAVPQVQRTMLLHSSLAQSTALASLCRAASTEACSASADHTPWATSPVLLYLLLVLRSRAKWLAMQGIQPLLLSLLRLVKEVPAPGPRRLLALRVAEEMVGASSQMISTLPHCQQALIEQMLSDQQLWTTAAAEVPLTMGGPIVLEDHGEVALWRLQGALRDLLVSRLAEKEVVSS